MNEVYCVQIGSYNSNSNSGHLIRKWIAKLRTYIQNFLLKEAHH